MKMETEKVKTKYCKGCGKSMEGKRSNAIYCSTSCKMFTWKANKENTNFKVHESARKKITELLFIIFEEDNKKYQDELWMCLHGCEIEFGHTGDLIQELELLAKYEIDAQAYEEFCWGRYTFPPTEADLIKHFGRLPEKRRWKNKS